jgi:hypothetical protein
MIDALHLYIGFVGGKIIRGFVIVVESKLRNDCGGGMNIAGDHAVRYENAVDVEHDPLRLPEREAAINDIGQAKTEDVRRELAEVKVCAFAGD